MKDLNMSHSRFQVTLVGSRVNAFRTLGIICLVLLLTTQTYAEDAEKLKFVFQYNTHSERTPMFTGDSHFDITKNNYNQGTNELTLNGLRNAFMQGENFKDQYSNHHNKFLPEAYNPSDYFIRSYPGNPSIMSSYAFVMGTDPELANGLGLIEEERGQGSVTNKDIDDTRKALFLDRPSDYSKPIYIHAGNSDGFFYRDIQTMYPGLSRDFDQNMEEASQEFENKYGTRLYFTIATMMGKSRGEVNFFNLSKYLDDYI